jgi:hypothetical protein
MKGRMMKSVGNEACSRFTYLVLSMLGSLEVDDFSQMTGMRSGYLSRIFADSALRASKVSHVSGLDWSLTKVGVVLLVVHL